MFQKFSLKRTTSQGKTTFVAVIEKSKGALELEGKEYTLAEVSINGTNWSGLKELYKDIRGG